MSSSRKEELHEQVRSFPAPISARSGLMQIEELLAAFCTDEHQLFIIVEHLILLRHRIINGMSLYASILYPSIDSN
jgi:hypothetical protein